MLLVSIHDVTPALAPEVRALWALCRDAGVVPALLVVPDWHGRAPLQADAGFRAWLRDCAAEGAEIFLHGFRHDEVGSPRAPLDHLRAFGRTHREGEFLTLGYEASAARISDGVAVLRAAGLEPAGFVPPGWLMRADALRAAARAGLALSEDDRAVFVLRTGRRLASPVVRWSARSRVRAVGSVAVERGRWLLQRRAPLLRLALHPRDLDDAIVARALAPALRRWLRERPAARYAELAR